MVKIHKKSQITVFIIIVLVLVMMFGITYYIINATTSERAEQEVLRQELSAAKVGPIKEYVTSCLSLASSEGLELLGKQGGYIYKSQGGLVDDFSPADIGKEFVEYSGTVIRYGIKAPVSNVGRVYFAQTPDYPWPTFPILFHPLTRESRTEFKGYYGRNRLPPFNRTEENSIPEQLEFFTVNEVLECIDWQSFTQQGLNITAEKPNVSIVMAERDVTFFLNWHLTIQDRATGAVTDLNEFIAVYPVRMKKIQKFAKLLMEEDVININYDIRASDGIITAYKTDNIFGRDDLITIRDVDSNILGEQYEFSFMRKNRPPALYYIPNESIKGPICNGSLIQSVPPAKLNIVNSCGDNFELDFNATDPDEDELEFSYNKQLPYEIKPIDVNIGVFKIQVKVSDGEYIDWQEISIETERG